MGVGGGASSYRVKARSLDSSGGPKAPVTAGMIAPSNWWIRGEGNEINGSALNPGLNAAWVTYFASNPGTIGDQTAINMGGPNLYFGPNNRFLGVDDSNHAIRVLNWQGSNITEDVTIIAPLVADNTALPLTALVVLDQVSDSVYEVVNPLTVSITANNSAYTSIIADPSASKGSMRENNI